MIKKNNFNGQVESQNQQFYERSTILKIKYRKMVIIYQNLNILHFHGIFGLHYKRNVTQVSDMRGLAPTWANKCRFGQVGISQ